MIPATARRERQSESPSLVLRNMNLVPGTKEEEDPPERRRPMSKEVEVDSVLLLKSTDSRGKNLLKDMSFKLRSKRVVSVNPKVTTESES